MVEVMVVKRMTGLMDGMVTYRSFCQKLAPSREADSYRSVGIA